MITMILISSVAMLVGIVGSVLIWGFDALRADEIEGSDQGRTSRRSARRASGA